MFNVESIALIGFAYIFILFLIAYFGDSARQTEHSRYNSNLVYALSLAVYCSSWTFYGAVGSAVTVGLDYLTIYLGPCLIFLFGYPLIRRIILICKQNSITSIADFISSRYGKNRHIGILVTVIAVVGSLPYIALQLKAVSGSYLILSSGSVSAQTGGFADNIALFTAVAMVLFSIIFGTRHLDATEHHKGMVLAIAFESIIKLVAILAVGYFAFSLFMVSGADIGSSGSELFTVMFAESNSSWSSFATKMLLSASAIFLLPRQFQVTIVEARDHKQFKTAMWVMPVYMLLTSIIVIPIAFAGSSLLPNSDADFYVLNLPLLEENGTLALLAFIGGLSAATGMVIVAAISLSTMVCNELVMPYLISLKRLNILKRNDLNNIILIVRRLAIAALMAGAYGYYVLIDSNARLANIGLVSFAATVQFLPAVLCALYWQRANRKGVFWGLLAGFAIWAYTLMLPNILGDQSMLEVFEQTSWLHPQSLFGLNFGDTLTHGVFWSLLVNIGLIVWYSLRENQDVLEKIQANRFFYIEDLSEENAIANKQSSYVIEPETLRILAERIIGKHNTEVLFKQFEQQYDVDLKQVKQVDHQLVLAVQNAIAGVIGTTSAEKVVADLLLGDDDYLEEVSSFVDETSSVLKFNRNLLQTTLQNITHGISVVDNDLNLVIWNDHYLQLFDYPKDFIYVGKPLREVLEYNAQRGDFGDKDHDKEIAKRLKYLQQRLPYSTIRHRPNGSIIKALGEPMPDGGFVTTYEDITDSVRASELLQQANEELESRVQERTRELESLTEELKRNTKSKTHFLAAASHDLLQPINAAKLFAYSIAEKKDDPKAIEKLASNIDQSLITANELLSALLDISRLDSDGIQPEYSDFSLADFVQNLIAELKPSANDKQVSLDCDIDQVFVRTDKQLLLSVLQNLISNAVKYTNQGGSVHVTTDVIDSDYLVLSVVDTGVGIAQDDLGKIFNEFYQVKSEPRHNAPGLGLGLSIVKRISRLLDLQISVESKKGQGSRFSVRLPIVQALSETSEQQPAATKSTTERLVGVQVLCLDNDLDVLEAMRTMLIGWGCEVVSVTSYSQGLDALKKQKYQIVLADYRLDSKETGMDFLFKVNQPLAQGVLITAEQNKQLHTDAIDNGFHYLAKPIEPAALKSLMLFLLSKGTS